LRSLLSSLTRGRTFSKSKGGQDVRIISKEVFLGWGETLSCAEDKRIGREIVGMREKRRKIRV